MKRTALTLAVATALLAGCGGSSYESVSDLVAALEEKGIDCPEFTQVDPSGHSAEHGSCAERAGETTLGLDVYESADDRDAEVADTVKGYADFDLPYCIVYADLWSVNATSSGQCDVIAREMDGETKQG